MHLSQYICQFTSLDINIISGGFAKFEIFPAESSSPYQGTEAGYVKLKQQQQQKKQNISNIFVTIHICYYALFLRMWF